MPPKRKTAKAPRPRVRPAVNRRATPARRKRVAPTPAQLRQRQELEALRAAVLMLRSNLRRTRKDLRRAHVETDRLRSLETEVEALRRVVGPQWPLLPLPDPPAAAREPWMPRIVETHLTALHDHDVAAVDGVLATDVVVTEAPFPQVTWRGRAEVAAWHSDLFRVWTDFRFMPRHWHNIGGAAFLEGGASFIQRGERHGMRANGKLVTLDMLLVYHLSEVGIGRIKLYYDAASLRRQVSAPSGQGELF
jgi:ketosteroid isomerase-like protein